MNWPDTLRIVVFGLFALTIGETAWIIKVYFKLAKETRALLPAHVFMFGVITMALELEAVMESVARYGNTGWTIYIPFNLVLFSSLYVALVLVRVHVCRKPRPDHLTFKDA